MESTGKLPGQRGFSRLSELNPASSWVQPWEQLPPALLGASGSPVWAGGCAGSSERDGGAVWLCKVPRSMDHRCHLPVTNIPETLLSPASPAGPSPRCWAAILECSGASLSSQGAAPTHRGDAVAVAGSWDLVPSPLWAKGAQPWGWLCPSSSVLPQPTPCSQL